MKDQSSLLRRIAGSARSVVFHSLLINFAFGLLLAVAIMSVRNPLDYFMPKRGVSGGGATAVDINIAPFDGPRLTADDPIHRFFELRVGHVLFSRWDANCRRALFDNQSGAFYEASEIQCLQNMRTDQSSARLQAMQSVFKNLK